VLADKRSFEPCRKANDQGKQYTRQQPESAHGICPYSSNCPSGEFYLNFMTDIWRVASFHTVPVK
jgi:hypothetical protein